VQKRILKDLAYEFVPKQLLDRPKQGFGVPIEKWLKTSLSDRVREYSRSGRLKTQGIFNPTVTQRFVDDFLDADSGGNGYNFCKTVWSFFVFQQWYSKYIQPLEG
jgi:asparagine synthase (glutamine-hydrolysing)